MTLHTERRGAVLLLTIDRPEARNAIDADLAGSLERALDEASAAEAVAAVVLAARGEVFLAGGDLRELAKLPLDASGAARVLELGEHLEAIERCAVPVIAAVQGDAIGGGAELVCMCDLVVMAADASLRFVHRNMGLVPAWGGTSRLMERVGAVRAADVLFCARPIGAAAALELGLVNRVAPAGAALDQALALAEEIAAAPRAALAALKRSLTEVERARRGAARERERAVFTNAWGSEPHRAAMDRVQKKRSLDRP